MGSGDDSTNTKRLGTFILKGVSQKGDLKKKRRKKEVDQGARDSKATNMGSKQEKEKGKLEDMKKVVKRNQPNLSFRLPKYTKGSIKTFETRKTTSAGLAEFCLNHNEKAYTTSMYCKTQKELVKKVKSNERSTDSKKIEIEISKEGNYEEEKRIESESATAGATAGTAAGAAASAAASAAGHNIYLSKEEKVLVEMYNLEKMIQEQQD
ncbi:hypothetical protein C2G38_2158339 [Gigaspora rosea]|uniref:Uncharacterized protein n=1 Tax=Gigaspora rosea TaxID=44941 RepID=A0A397W0G6_9GLOM|nr:hypothetical protein C2G38_2158339 [Gigaspora rosea]